MRISAAQTPVTNFRTTATSSEPAATTPVDGVESKGPSKALRALKRGVFYSTTGLIPGVGAASNFLATQMATDQILRKIPDSSSNPTSGFALSVGAGLLAAVPNVVGLITHQTGWYMASFLTGGIAGVVSAYTAPK